MPRTNTIASVIRSGLEQGWSTEEILAEVHSRFPAARTGPNDVRWYRWSTGHNAMESESTVPGASYPMTDLLTDRFFGLEFEFLTRDRSGQHRSIDYWGDVIRRALGVGANLRVSDTYTHSDGRQWHLKIDGSCGYELASPKLTKRDWPVVVRVLEALTAAGAKVNRSCGLHVHHDMSDYNRGALRRLVQTWSVFGRVIGQLLPASRRSNYYCMPLSPSAADLSDYDLEAYGSDKYRALNIRDYWRSGRVEVRQHNGTLNARKVLAWVALTQKTIEEAKVSPETLGSAAARSLEQLSPAEQFARFVSRINLGAQAVDFFRGRLSRHARRMAA